MGDHHIGRQMATAARLALSERRAGEDAISILDRICMPHRGRDAEFEAEDPDGYDSETDPHPKAALGMLMLEAFAPDGADSLARYAGMGSDDPDEDERVTDLWWNEVYEPFRARYAFC
jgi:hypothetical protein